jgi:hypothetical protein
VGENPAGAKGKGYHDRAASAILRFWAGRERFRGDDPVSVRGIGETIEAAMCTKSRGDS